jgi:hypothetical protein
VTGDETLQKTAMNEFFSMIVSSIGSDTAVLAWRPTLGEHTLAPGAFEGSGETLVYKLMVSAVSDGLCDTGVAVTIPTDHMLIWKHDSFDRGQRVYTDTTVEHLLTFTAGECAVVGALAGSLHLADMTTKFKLKRTAPKTSNVDKEKSPKHIKVLHQIEKTTEPTEPSTQT